MLLQMDFIKQELENTEVPILLVISFYCFNVLFFHYDAGILEGTKISYKLGWTSSYNVVSKKVTCIF